MTLQEMKERVQQLGLTFQQVSEFTHIPLNSLEDIFQKVPYSLTFQYYQSLEKFLRNENPLCIREESVYHAEEQQGNYTLEDYYALPEECRVELIDGVFYDLNAPAPVHQIIAGNIYAGLLHYIEQKKGTCIPIMSPADVQLDKDDKTMLQPDLFIICDRDQILSTHLYGAPDFIVEVLSKSTRKKDMKIKLNKYRNAGVREYWMIDPKARQVLVYVFSREANPVIYGFDAKIPVNIFQDDCMIDFQEIYDYIRFLYQ